MRAPISKFDPDTARYMRRLGVHLRQLRESRNISQGALARAIGMERPNYSRIEKGLVNVTIETLLRIVGGLDAELAIRAVPRKSRRSR